MRICSPAAPVWYLCFVAIWRQVRFRQYYSMPNLRIAALVRLGRASVRQAARGRDPLSGCCENDLRRRASLMRLVARDASVPPIGNPIHDRIRDHAERSSFFDFIAVDNGVNKDALRQTIKRKSKGLTGQIASTSLLVKIEARPSRAWVRVVECCKECGSEDAKVLQRFKAPDPPSDRQVIIKGV